MPGLALLILITVALGFEFINGFHDTANAIAVSIHTGALSAGRAVALAAVMNLLGAFASENVARTISGELISAAIDEYTIIAALIAAIIWNLFTWYLGMPASSSHALIGALIGASVVFTGSTDAVLWKNLVLKVVLPLFLCPPFRILSYSGAGQRKSSARLSVYGARQMPFSVIMALMSE